MSMNRKIKVAHVILRWLLVEQKRIKPGQSFVSTIRR